MTTHQGQPALSPESLAAAHQYILDVPECCFSEKAIAHIIDYAFKMRPCQIIERTPQSISVLIPLPMASEPADTLSLRGS